MWAAIGKFLANELKKTATKAALGDESSKKKIIALVITVISLFLIIIVLLVTVIFGPIILANQYIEDSKNEITLFFDKLGNALTLQGWCSNQDGSCQKQAEQKYYEQLNSTYAKYKNKGVEIDVELITGTIFYGSTLNNEQFIGEEIDDSDDIPTIESNKYENIKLIDVKTLAANMVNSNKIDYTKYREYLISTYIPSRFKHLYSESNSEKNIEFIADEIMGFSSYTNAFGSNNTDKSCYVYSCNTVFLTGDHAGEYSLEDYVKGVVNAESGGMIGHTNKYKEQWKAQAIAARSMVLSNYDICTESVPNTTNFQAFKPNWSQELSDAVDETAGMILTYNNEVFLAQYDAFYKGTGSDYYCDDELCYSKYYIRGSGQQSTWETHIVNTYAKYSTSFLEGSNGHGIGMSQWGAAYLADIGKNYEEILEYYYADNIEISKIGNSCSIDTNGFDWRQNDPRWGSKSYGTTTLGKSGCNLTSIAIEIAYSGVPTVIDNFNPGTLFDYMKARNYLGTSGRTLSYAAFTEVAPDFNYVGGVDMSGYSDQQIHSTLINLIDNNNYPIVHVKSGNLLPYPTTNHWVAVVGYTEDDIEIIDPANTGCTRLFSCKPGLDRSNGYGVVDRVQYWN